MDTCSIDTKFVWFGFPYMPHSLSVSVTRLCRKKEMHLAVVFEFYSVAKMFSALMPPCEAFRSCGQLQVTTSLPDDRRGNSSLSPITVASGHHQKSKTPGSSAKHVSLTADNQRTWIKVQTHRHCDIWIE